MKTKSSEKRRRHSDSETSDDEEFRRNKGELLKQSKNSYKTAKGGKSKMVKANVGKIYEKLPPKIFIPYNGRKQDPYDEALEPEIPTTSTSSEDKSWRKSNDSQKTPDASVVRDAKSEFWREAMKNYAMK